MPLTNNKSALADIQRQCNDDSLEWFPKHIDDISYLVHGLTGEAGEVSDMLKKAIRGSIDLDGSEARVAFAFELADVLIYTCLIANTLGLDLAETYKMKRDINVGRFGKTDQLGENGSSSNGMGE